MSDSVMNDLADQEPAPIPEAVSLPSSPGALLAARRDELGLTVERVAEQLKMTPRQILAIETDNYVALHGKAIYRGFVRAYAKVLRMESDSLVAMIPDDKAAPKQLAPAWRGVSAPFSETRLPAMGRRNFQSKRMVIAIAMVALLIGILVFQKMGWMPSLPQLTSSGSDTASASSAPIITEKSEKMNSAAVESGSSKDKVKQIDLPIVDVSSQLSSASAATVATIPVPSDASADVAAPAKSDVDVKPQSAIAPDTSNTLVLKCREESWVEIRRANGSVLFSGRVAAGTTETIAITEPVQLTLGNGPGVDATLRGAPLEVKPEAGSKVVRLNLK